MAKQQRLRVGVNLYVWLAVVFSLAPTIIVLGMSVNPGTYFVFPPDGFTINWFREAVVREEWRTAFLNSIKLAAATACGATALGVVAALALHRSKLRVKSVIVWWFVAPMLVPQLLLGFALLVLLMKAGIGLTWYGLFTGHVLVTFPFVMRLVFAGFPAITASIEDAAATLGADQWTVLRTIVVPVLKPAIFSGWLFAFVLSFDNVMGSLFLASVRTPLLPVKILSTVTWTGDPTVAAASAIFIVVSLGLMVLLDRTIGLRFEGAASHT